MAEKRAAVEYHAKDFEWDELRVEVEKDPSLLYHLAPPSPRGHQQDHPSSSSSHDSDAWRSFHRRHSTGRFFKERSAGESIVVYACDCSPDALERAKEMVETAGNVSTKERFHPFLLDLSLCGFPKWLFCNSCQRSLITRQMDCPSDVKDKISVANDSPLLEVRCCIGGVDYVTLVFTLSAAPFQKMPFILSECISVLKPGGLLLFRDYGLYDMTMLRFPPEQKVGFREYMRSDGTFSYFFSLDVVRNLFLGAGFIELELEYCCIRSMNHLNGKSMRRVWVHGKFQKPV